MLTFKVLNDRASQHEEEVYLTLRQLSGGHIYLSLCNSGGAVLEAGNILSLKKDISSGKLCMSFCPCVNERFVKVDPGTAVISQEGSR